MSTSPRPSIELADQAQPLARAADRRPPMPEPPAVRLVAVEDVTIVAPSGAERELDALYVDVLKFERMDEPAVSRPVVQPILGGEAPKIPPVRALREPPPLSSGGQRGPIYLAENVRLYVEIHEPPIEQNDFRPLRVLVPLLSAIIEALDQRQIAYTRQVGVVPGDRSILLQDVAGNWIEVSEARPI